MPIDLDYSAAGVAVRADLQDAHRRILDHIRSPGTWWSGAERIAIAAEARHALDCSLCKNRQAALSPNSVSGQHDSLGGLDGTIVEVIHRVRTDPGRLSRAWFDGVIAAGVSVPQYVEVIAVVTLLTGVDFCARALGLAPFALPPALPGEPSHDLPPAAKPGPAWVPMIAVEDAAGADADIYFGLPFVPNIVRALSQVPDEVRALWQSSDAHYLPVAQIPDPTARRALDRMQMELVAARVSALNQCFY
ncbi:MAG: hypothetical protein HY270_05740 [Deltaproteobacteria bacterium]|nr:hypothetical protein [Deltaproteobacteria bacterium]